MKQIHLVIFLLFSILIASSAAAQQKVVVIPLSKCPDPLKSCAGTCVDTLNNPAYCGGCANSCNPGSFCNQGTCQQIDCTTHADCPQGRCDTNLSKCIAVKLVFLSENPVTYSMGGLAGADALCQAQAQAGNLPGTYKAWLSDETASPDTRFQKYDMPYMRTDGVRIADNWQDLTDGTIQAQINVLADVTRTGVPSTTTNIWTGTATDGTFKPGNGLNSGVCNNWVATTSGSITFYNSMVGFIAVATPTAALDNGFWTEMFDQVCFNDADPNLNTYKKYIYCFQQ